MRTELVPLAYTDDVNAPKVAQIETVFPNLGRQRNHRKTLLHLFPSFFKIIFHLPSNHSLLQSAVGGEGHMVCKDTLSEDSSPYHALWFLISVISCHFLSFFHFSSFPFAQNLHNVNGGPVSSTVSFCISGTASSRSTGARLTL